jgi:hypothetical protein
VACSSSPSDSQPVTASFISCIRHPNAAASRTAEEHVDRLQRDQTWWSQMVTGGGEDTASGNAAPLGPVKALQQLTMMQQCGLRPLKDFPRFGPNERGNVIRGHSLQRIGGGEAS